MPLVNCFAPISNLFSNPENASERGRRNNEASKQIRSPRICYVKIVGWAPLEDREIRPLPKVSTKVHGIQSKKGKPVISQFSRGELNKKLDDHFDKFPNHREDFEPLRDWLIERAVYMSVHFKKNNIKDAEAMDKDLNSGWGWTTFAEAEVMISMLT